MVIFGVQPGFIWNHWMGAHKVWCCFGSILLSHSKTINAKVLFSQPMYQTQLSESSTILTRVEDPKIKKHQVKEWFDIQARGPQKREDPGICPVWPTVNPSLPLSSQKLHDRVFHSLSSCSFPFFGVRSSLSEHKIVFFDAPFDPAH